MISQLVHLLGRRRAPLGITIFALLASACTPIFSAGQELTIKAQSDRAQIIWNPATDLKSDHDVDHYEIRANNQVVANVAAPATACTLRNLNPTTSYTITVTAYSNTNEWSGVITGSLSQLGTLTSTFTTASAWPGGVPYCSTNADADGDGLPNWAETNTGTFIDAARAGTNPNNPDTDGDSISDGDEVLGTVDGLPLPLLGTDPLRKTILMEFDWFDDALECAAHSHQPPVSAISEIVTAFANSPVSNPDGSTGIDLIADYGQGGAFIGGNFVNDSNGVLAGGVSGSEFANYKAANFASNRNGYFHYTLLPHRYDTNSTSSGQAEVSGDDLIVSLYCYGTAYNVSRTIMHELGHNLSLRHGGQTTDNNKPNYNSVMNYNYTFPGIDINCDRIGDGVMDYSIGTRLDLNENNLNENQGMCTSGPAIDWNGNSIFEASVSKDINLNGTKTILSDYNDWANLTFIGIGDADGPSLTQPEIVTEQPVPTP